MSISVRIPTPLRSLTFGQAEVIVEATTVAEALKKLDAEYRGFQDRVLDNDGNVKRFINVFVNEDNIRDRKDVATEVKSGDTISILPSIAGGQTDLRFNRDPRQAPNRPVRHASHNQIRIFLRTGLKHRLTI